MDPCDPCKTAFNTYLNEYTRRRVAEDPEFAAKRAADASRRYDSRLAASGHSRLYDRVPEAPMQLGEFVEPSQLGPIRRSDFSTEAAYNVVRADRWPTSAAARVSAQIYWKYKRRLDDYDRVLEEQGGGCASCGTLPPGRRLSWDHDHACCPEVPTCGACVRGLLCHMCNLAVGAVESGLAAKAAVYLEAYA